MAHEIFNNSFAYVGEPAWHRLGTNMAVDATKDQWVKTAGFDWDAVKTPVSFDFKGETRQMSNRFVIHRSDDGTPLSVMSGNFQIMQPREVIDWMYETTKTSGAKMETAGVLNNGSKFWALARFDDSFDLPGDSKVLPYLMLATSLDGSMSSTAAFTTVRVVCANTLAYARREVESGNNAAPVVRVPHSTKFNGDEVAKQLGLFGDNWTSFKKQSVAMANTAVDEDEAVRYFLKVLHPGTEKYDLKNPQMAKLLEVYKTAPGQNTAAAQNTVWGMLNAVTRYADHEVKSSSDAKRLESSWFGRGSRVKATALDAALALV